LEKSYFILVRCDLLDNTGVVTEFHDVKLALKIHHVLYVHFSLISHFYRENFF
jgi:hypothetical protein